MRANWVALGFFFSAIAVDAQTAFWVLPAGNDQNPGTKNAPVATLARAAELVRTARAERPGEAVTVWLGEGTYPLLNGLTFTEADSGSAAAPVVWRGVERSRVRFIGARPVTRDKFRPVRDPALLARMVPEARGQITELDLSAEGVRLTKAFPDYQREPADLFAIFSEGRRLPISRWPNGEYGYTTIKRVLSSGSFKARQSDGGVFEYREERPERWLAALADGGVWVRGFWRVPWNAETLRVKTIDPAARTLGLAVSVPDGIGSKYSKVVEGTRVGDGKEYWHALNLLEEIDQPGEWSVDFKRGKLFIWLPVSAKSSSLFIADSAAPLLTFDGASHLIFRDISLGLNAGDGITITDGEAVQLAGCMLTGVVRRGIVIRGGRGHRVQSCDISEIGLTALDMLGGDRSTLEKSGFEIVNNHFFRIALNAPQPALTVGSSASNQKIVGARVAYNRIHDTSYSGITFAGNDHIFEYNEIYRVGLDGGDLGSFYTTGGWTSRGNVVRGNFLHHSENSNAIYADDGSSGLLVEDNLIYRTESGVFIGGGHDHTVRRNIIVSSARAFHVDDRGVSRKYVATDRRLRGDLDSVPYTESPWRERYPALLGILDQDPSVPRGNVLTGNYSVGCTTLARRSVRPESMTGITLSDNVELADAAAVFKNPAALDFTPTPASGLPAFALSRYGLQRDAYRTVLPERDLQLLRDGDTKRKAFDSQQDVDAYKRR
jgi:hypothetical protein